MDSSESSFLDSVRAARDSIFAAMNSGATPVRVCLSLLWVARFSGLAETEASGFLTPPVSAARFFGVPVEDCDQVNVAEVHFADGTCVAVSLERP